MILGASLSEAPVFSVFRASQHQSVKLEAASRNSLQFKVEGVATQLEAVVEL